mmetsp:Transcript_4689/g.4377  ORF Transcript_4689/g.4377 Transcript_4689/m.4377 type:complete len:83 (-) Transcript_4689:2-250(-)
MKQPKSKYSWKPVKTKLPDPGSYNHDTAIKRTSLIKRSQSAVFGKLKRTKLYKKKTEVPGVGTYKLDKVLEKISRPMKTSRR